MMLSSRLSVNRYSASRRLEFDNYALGLFLAGVFPKLRASLISAFLAILLLCGYTVNLATGCVTATSAESHHEACGDHHEAEENSQSNACETACHCVCHSSYALQPAFNVQIAKEAVATGAYALPTGQFPPDAVPLGIDYPPQIA